MTEPYFVEYNVRVPMRDGVTLSADIFRPTVTRQGKRVPVILVRTPYNKNKAYYVKPGHYFAAHGYAYVTLDVRGRGDSDGTFIGYRNEGVDGYDAILWCAAQSWSDGNVGTLGASYLGRIQWLTALEIAKHHPPAQDAAAPNPYEGFPLKTMVVLVTPSDPFVENPTGVPTPDHLCWWYAVNGRLEQWWEGIDWKPIYEHLPLVTMDERVGFHSTGWHQELEHPTLDAYWQALQYQNQFHKINLPVMHISGWYDEQQIGTPLNFIGMQTHGATAWARKNQKMLMGPWGHDVNTVRTLGKVDFGAEALIDLYGYERRWFDHWLKGADSGILNETPVRLFVMGANEWRDENEYPLARTQFTTYYLHSGGNAVTRFGDGTLSTELPVQEPPDVFVYDPANATPHSTATTAADVLQTGGPDDYAAVQERRDVLVYVTPPLDRDLELIGPVRVTLYAASSAVDTDFTALLFDLHPDGFAQRLCDGIVRARYRGGMEKAELIEPHRVYAYDLNLWNTCQRIFAGHRIGVQIASAAFPKYDRNLNTGESIATGTRMLTAGQTIYHDAAHPSALVLPVVENKDQE